MIPIIFTVVLIGVLLTLFNVDIRNNMLEFADKIPIVRNWVPDPVKDPEKTKLQDAKDQVKSANATIDELKSKLASKDADLEKSKEEKAQQDQKLKSVQEQLDSAQKPAENASADGTDPNADPYEKQIKDLAKMYSDMSPSKAAPIMQNMTMDEMVQLLSAMKNDNRMAILAKMDPKMAADVSMKLKDAVSSSDLAIAALQSRIDKDTTTQKSASTSGLDKSQISQTFASMPAKSAAGLLLSTYKISPEKVLTILNSVDDATRSGILDAMSTQDAKTTAVILNKLMSK
ncbi:kinesin [Paenibacillus sp. HJL G12]|uniref:Kinesin n=1 Tax=Paenibacillus dendrobii TaxID=2691084 RepID=A0A7X3IGK0_9BACL|nr:kinesin [Paenibacillus dendrobii]MWV43548.1 kinesin [Paenibacillus dendrobii]